MCAIVFCDRSSPYRHPQEVMECLDGLLMPFHLPGQKDKLLAKRGFGKSQKCVMYLVDEA